MKNNFAANLFSNLFSIADYGETHYIMRVFGIKIKFPKREFALKKKQSPYYYYKKNNIDITTLPPATGQIREIQLANLELLKELDYVCRQNNLKYWLDAGTLIGAIRHKGFIPWDDDIDAGMPREDYNKIIEAFKSTSRNPDIFTDYYRDKKNPAQIIIKVQHKECEFLAVDIFPFDIYGEKISTKEQLLQTKNIHNICRKLKKTTKFSMQDKELLKMIDNTMYSQILKNSNPGEDNNVIFVWGLDFHHRWNNWFTEYDVIYPLKEIEFEGYKFLCLNNPDAFLTRVYGDYMSYPQKITFGHSMYLKLSDFEKESLKKLPGSAE